MDDTRLKAVEVIPASLPRKLTDLQKQIVYWTIKFAGCKSVCYLGRPLTPDLVWLDFAKLRGLEILKLAELVRFIAEKTGLIINRQEVAYTLAVCGIRVPRKGSQSRD
ncbi:hypothetical protein [Methyloceanibacter marginalis]|uniref:hypothetical protein n=1 Tax=Methyloceanibacter marginalis TaxID=1774971 RepID=UPI00114CAC21|nr:hypothetical protein [Methyloceanibacter marginalis]